MRTCPEAFLHGSNDKHGHLREGGRCRRLCRGRARILKMSPSTVTAHVQSLEERLGARLLNRSTRNISLTEVGTAYYDRCLQILADADEADSVAQALQSTPRGKLRLNASVTIPPLLAPVIAEFTALYPRSLAQHDHERPHGRSR